MKPETKERSNRKKEKKPETKQKKTERRRRRREEEGNDEKGERSMIRFQQVKVRYHIQLFYKES
jgi:hypothetical protein